MRSQARRGGALGRHAEESAHEPWAGAAAPRERRLESLGSDAQNPETSLTASVVASIGEIYRKTRKVPDLPWNTYVCRPLAAVVVAAIQRTRVTPNQVTLFAMVVAAVSAAMIVFLPGYWGLVLAMGVYEASYVLDCADGMLARLRGGGSAQGHLLDFLMDEIKAFAVLAAVSVRLWLDHGRDEKFLVGGLCGLVAVASGVALTTFLRRPEIATSPAPGASSRSPTAIGRAISLAEAIAKQVIHYPSYILLVALADRLTLYFYPYVVVNALYAARAMLQVTLRFGRSGGD
jgi:phosphatidylglycerophosphate synthase